MIGQLRGTLLDKSPPLVVLDVAGVGYEIQVSMNTFYRLPELNAALTLFIHMVVREDAQLLFGFCDQAERSLFRELIKTNGVGPKLACTILSGLNCEQLLTAVQQDDLTTLVKVPGIGKKTAERLLIELKDRLASFGQTLDAQHIEPAIQADAVNPSPLISSKQEAIGALVALGYKPVQAEKAINQVYDPKASSETLIKLALKAML